MPIHVVQQGECITSIADAHGFFWETIWSDEHNAELRKVRSDPHTLRESDAVFIPELRRKTEVCDTSKRHTFRRRGIPAMLRVQLFDMMRPRRGESFTITLDTGEVRNGTADREGVVCISVPTKARSATLVIGPDSYTVQLELGDMAPIETLEGQQARLRNLGFFDGKADGADSPALQQATVRFQTAYGLAATGEIDDATRDLIYAMHDKPNHDPTRMKKR